MIDGRVAGELDTLKFPAGHCFVNFLFSLHTCEEGGVAGRLLALGCWR